ncbi:hypothetical protein T484DRAFT_1932611 [Baffinella frigidus]|nr:hypothetical protein T484DRAFT_1932611 [Cryptophyta sp. CCMP2293]
MLFLDARRPSAFLALSTTLLVIVALCAPLAHAMDVSWIPSDPDGPLPMSSVFRDKLDILCSTIEIGRGLPQNIPPEKRQAVNSMCTKLRAQVGGKQNRARNNLFFHGDGVEGASPLWILVLIAGVGYIMYLRVTPSSITSFRTKKRWKEAAKRKRDREREIANGGEGTMTPEESAQAREARLVKFDAWQNRDLGASGDADAEGPEHAKKD